MAYKNFSFDPEAGFSDTGFYEDTPSNPREILQRQHNQTRDYINSVIDTLNSSTEGSSGSESIKSPEIEGVTGNNVYEQLKDIKRQINDAAEAVIPDSSVTRVKLADGAVTKSKISDGEITTEKLNDNLVAPFANETLNVNSEDSSLYTPLYKTGFAGFLKELVCKEPLESIEGQIFNGKRYIINNNLLYTLDLETGELESFGTTTLPSDVKVAVCSEELVYLVKMVEENSYMYIYVYKYEREYDELIYINKIKAFYNYNTAGRLCGLAISDTHMFIGAARRMDSSTTYDYYYKISLDKLSTLKEASIYYSYLSPTKIYPQNIVYFNNDIYFGTKIFKDTLTDEITDFFADVTSVDDYGNILVNNPLLPLWDNETKLPKGANFHTTLIDSGFVYNNYYYILAEGYLFKARIS